MIPTIETERLSLRRWEVRDFEPVARAPSPALHIQPVQGLEHRRITDQRQQAAQVSGAIEELGVRRLGVSAMGDSVGVGVCSAGSGRRQL